jgi:6-pyruvoyltetrahydropterin/6-carboxytetrahydropterin synthase
MYQCRRFHDLPESRTMQETYVEFAFDAAHKTTPDTPLHGHSFKARAFLTGCRHPIFGWSHDLLEVQKVLRRLRERLDNICLNDIDGLDYPTLENVAAWIWHELNPVLPGLDRVQLWRGVEGFAEGCIYSGHEIVEV